MGDKFYIRFRLELIGFMGGKAYKVNVLGIIMLVKDYRV
jgi:hypothetical protein